MGFIRKPKYKRIGTPTEIHGVRYPSMSEAARQLGIHINTIERHMEAGTLDQIGKHPYSGKKQPNRWGNPPNEVDHG